jgi:hypothetical protein
MRLRTPEETEALWERHRVLGIRIRSAGHLREFDVFVETHSYGRNVIGFIAEDEAFIAKMCAQAAEHPEWYPRRDWVIEEDGFPRRRRDVEKDMDQLREEAEERRQQLDEHEEYMRRYGRAEPRPRPEEPRRK